MVSVSGESLFPAASGSTLSPMVSSPAPNPVHVDLRADEQIPRWQPLVAWLLLVPHWIVLWALSILQRGLTLVAFITILISKEIPQPIFDLTVMTYRYQWRVISYLLCFRNDYPPFEFPIAALDPGVDKATLSIDPPTQLNRWLPFVKWILAIPHYVVLFFLAIASVVTILVGYIAVIVTGAYPPALRDFQVGVTR